MTRLDTALHQLSALGEQCAFMAQALLEAASTVEQRSIAAEELMVQTLTDDHVRYLKLARSRLAGEVLLEVRNRTRSLVLDSQPDAAAVPTWEEWLESSHGAAALSDKALSWSLLEQLLPRLRDYEASHSTELADDGTQAVGDDLTQISPELEAGTKRKRGSDASVSALSSEASG
ncbi:hypothetical protein HDU91_005986, partial [Kappamyces sp. JEL0680]